MNGSLLVSVEGEPKSFLPPALFIFNIKMKKQPEDIIYWQIPKFYSKPECKRIIDLGLSKETGEAKVGEFENVNNSVRDTEVSWLEEQWMYDRIAPAINDCCINAGWHTEWDWMEAIQFGIYGEGKFYNWHQDNRAVYTKDTAKNENWLGKTRKVSASIILNDDYEGGEFQLWQTAWFVGDELPKGLVHSPGKKRGVAPAGTLIVFPSHLHHRVTPVTKGIRYSLVIWCLGKP